MLKMKPLTHFEHKLLMTKMLLDAKLFIELLYDEARTKTFKMLVLSQGREVKLVLFLKIGDCFVGCDCVYFFFLVITFVKLTCINVLVVHIRLV